MINGLITPGSPKNVIIPSLYSAGMIIIQRKNFLGGHQPEGNGAFLIKNSWGSELNEFPNNGYRHWGLLEGQDLSDGKLQASIIRQKEKIIPGDPQIGWTMDNFPIKAYGETVKIGENYFTGYLVSYRMQEISGPCSRIY